MIVANKTGLMTMGLTLSELSITNEAKKLLLSCCLVLLTLVIIEIIIRMRLMIYSFLLSAIN